MTQRVADPPPPAAQPPDASPPGSGLPPASGPPAPSRGSTMMSIATTGPNQPTPSCTSWNASWYAVGVVTSGALIAKVKRPVAPGA